MSSATVTAAGEPVSRIGPGMLVLLGIRGSDTETEAERTAAKVAKLRIFDDAEGRINDPLGDREVLCVSQFTLYGDVARGNRPSFVAAARPEAARPLYELVCDRLEAARGAFGEHMEVALVNDGPITLLVESEAPGA